MEMRCKTKDRREKEERLLENRIKGGVALQASDYGKIHMTMHILSVRTH